MATEREKFRKLETLGAWGATEGRSMSLSELRQRYGSCDTAIDAIGDQILLGHKMFEDFRAGRNLKREAVMMEMIPWLFRARFYSKKWEETYNTNAPFHDHTRYFIDKDTRQRIATIQPYLFTVARESSVEVPNEFRRIYANCTNPFKPLPDSPVVKETIQAVLDKAKKVSDEFANEYGLQASVSFNGWYNPERVILIEYRKAA